MSVLATNAGLSARPVSRAAGFRVELLGDWKQAVARWHDLGPSTPFQHPAWYDAWYKAFAGTEGVAPLIAVVTDASTGDPAMLLPLIRRRQGRIAIIEFADLDLTDYNAPFLGAAAPRDAKAVRHLWRSLLSALRRMPDPADLVRLRKVPVEFGGRPNPLALLDTAGSCALNGNLVTTGEDYDAWRYTLEKTVRKELERSWRVFTRDPAASFALLTDADQAQQILSTTEAQQGTRMRSLGMNYVLDDASRAAFYRNLVRNSVGSGYALVSALTVGDEVVATLLGIRTGARYVMIRISNAGEKWSNCSPGRLIIERTMAALHRDGVREFDFSVGNYAYKRRFGVTPLPLVDISAALSWRGWPFALRDRAVGVLRDRPQLDARLRRILGKPLSREEN
ncbi:GNAT family N-acetyltransferase [Bradyrhizobium sp. CB3481]|uniref:GNAT family N-acetyltransferase n=1 Tax=Bradyrhizobium sp. CB3481 TaxID=3039158 RepID=UPI0024B1A354|nr:GNAT family N-acetyltransferase [Bradyrhizobium sp. CB3481]WFU17849.1 GNAT family N-acetyltransferase [Bradyrhizobium sp. CB3481]